MDTNMAVMSRVMGGSRWAGPLSISREKSLKASAPVIEIMTNMITMTLRAKLSHSLIPFFHRTTALYPSPRTVMISKSRLSSKCLRSRLICTSMVCTSEAVSGPHISSMS